ncbi:hypothetical protein [Aliifodinibius sp. S!AR15-10]|nr:hypothetical protein [Aliifodinibius sp. S!AR15-10]
MERKSRSSSRLSTHPVFYETGGIYDQAFQDSSKTRRGFGDGSDELR